LTSVNFPLNPQYPKRYEASEGLYKKLFMLSFEATQSLRGEIQVGGQLFFGEKLKEIFIFA
jgi:hypothetical protein